MIYPTLVGYLSYISMISH